MSKRIPKAWVVVLLVAAAFAGVVFVVLNRAFGGPGSAAGSDRYELHVKFADAQQLMPKSLVLVRGVKVGEVTSVKPSTSGTDVTFTIDDRYGGAGRGAFATVGWRTAFGEAYLRLDRGNMTAAAPLPSGTVISGRESVEADEALEVLDGKTRDHLGSAIRSVGETVDAPGAADDARESIDALASTSASLNRLTTELRGQGDEIAELVGNGKQVVGALAASEGSLREITRSGSATARALSGKSEALRSGVAEIEPLMRSASATLKQMPGLLSTADGVQRDISAAVTAVKPALQQVGPASSSAEGLVKAMPGLSKSATPALKDLAPVVDGLAPVGESLDPVLRNIIPLAEWLQPRAKDYAAVFTNIASATDHGDSEGKWLRLFLIQDYYGTDGRDMSVTCGKKQLNGACFNPYPEGGSAGDAKPYKPGTYPRLTPYPKP